VEGWAAMNLFSGKIKPSKNLKILYVIDSLEVGGAEKQLLMLANELHLKQESIYIYALRGEGALIEPLKRAGIQLFKGPFRNQRHIPSFIFGLLDLSKTILKIRPDVINGFLPLSSLMVAILGRVFFIKQIVISKRGLGKHQDSNPKWQYLDRISNLFSHKITVNSQAVKTDLIKRDNVLPSKISCIYNGIDLSKFNKIFEPPIKIRSFLGIKHDEFAWVNVANFTAHKGHLDLVNAFHKINTRHNVKLFLIGRDRGNLQIVQKLIHDLHEGDRIKVLGFIDNVHEILKSMNGFVSASHTEGFSNALLEGMAANLKIVATDVGGNREALLNGKYGKIVQPYSVKSLTSAMEFVMSNQGSIESKERARIYSKENMALEYLNLYSTGII
jgi:glycosyltransferase involved in cell wall biosynthesis